MEDEHRGVALVILGVIAIVAIIGLVLMFTGPKNNTGLLFTSATGGTALCPMSTQVGQPQWFPVLAGPWENPRFLQDWVNAGYECIPAQGAKKIDEYGYQTWCCRNPVFGKQNVDPQVDPRGPVPLKTRQGSGVQVGSSYLGTYQYAAPNTQTSPPRVGP